MNLLKSKILDVRTSVECEAVCIEGCVNIPLNQLSALKVGETFSKDEEVVVLCKGGKRAEKAKAMLDDMGFQNTVVYVGGIDAWIKSGGEVSRKQGGVIPLERQVRIAAGILIVLGVGLGWYVNPSFFLLAGFVGCGLIFAGVTDSCGMGMLLAKMPWNR